MIQRVQDHLTKFRTVHENCADPEVGAVGHPARDERIPASAKRRAAASPIPLATPVMSAVLPVAS
jgi:hypothetical protein